MPAYVPAAALSPGPADVEGVSVLRGLKAVFESEHWKSNVLLGLVLLLIPIVGPIALGGWMCEAHQRHVRRHPNPFPKIDFGDFGDYIKRGLAPFLTGLIITFPLLFVIYALMGGTAFAVFAAIAATNEPLVGAAVGLVVGVIALFLMMILQVPMNAAQTRAELTEELGEALSFGKIMSYSKATFGRVIVKNFIFMWVGLGIVLLGILMCYLGVYPAAVVLQIAAMHLRYQIYADYLARGGEPIPLKQPQPLQSEARMQQPPPGAY